MLRGIRSVIAGGIAAIAILACSDTTKPTSSAATAQAPTASEGAAMVNTSSGKSTICMMYRTNLKTAATLREATESRMSAKDLENAKADEQELQDVVKDVCN